VVPELGIAYDKPRAVMFGFHETKKDIKKLPPGMMTEQKGIMSLRVATYT